MNANYDMNRLREGLNKTWKRLAELGEHREGNEVEEALHVLATKAAWITRARPVIYHMDGYLENSDGRLGDDTHEFMREAGKLLDGWLPPPTRQVSFDGENWIDLPYNCSVPHNMKSRDKTKGAI